MQSTPPPVSPTPESVLLNDGIADFFLARRPRKDSPHTTLAYQRDLAAIRQLCAQRLDVAESELRLDQLTVAVLRVAFADYSESRAKTSISRAWSTWNQFLAFCVSDGRISGNPMSGVAKPRLPRRAPKPLRGEDTPERLLASVASRRDGRDPWPERDLAVLATLLLTGVRSAELLSLSANSLVGPPGDRRLHVVGKGGKSRSVPVEKPLEVVLDAYLASRQRRFPGTRISTAAPLFIDRRGGQLQRGGLQYLVKTNLRWAGLNDRRSTGALVHALRHTYATRLAEDGASASEIMALLGHVSITTSQAYIDATAREQRAAAGANRTYRVVRELFAAPTAGEQATPGGT
jgi:integrase/recombinase XerC